MRTLVHLSDLHFGAADPEIVAALRDDIIGVRPDVIAVSGDLTQRARRYQFAAARSFLRALPAAQVTVPGNHDVPLYNLVARFAWPLANFQRYIGSTHDYVDDPELVVVGADSTRSFTIKDGGLSSASVKRLLRQLDAAPAGALRALVCHHPFDRVPRHPTRWTLPVPWGDAIGTLVANGLDIILTGHLHLSYCGYSAARYHTEGRSAIVVEAGTATSKRVRGEGNAYNVLTVERDRVSVERRQWSDAKRLFVPGQREEFARGAEGWSVA